MSAKIIPFPKKQYEYHGLSSSGTFTLNRDTISQIMTQDKEVFIWFGSENADSRVFDLILHFSSEAEALSNYEELGEEISKSRTDS